MKKQYQRLLTFAMVGGWGFIVDVASLFLLSHWLPLPFARGGAFWIAATSNWWLNRQFTFKGAKTTVSPHQQWGQFLAASCVGCIPNVGCYWGLMWGVTPWIMAQNSLLLAQCWPYFAMIPGIIMGMVINFTLSDRWVFRSVSV